jgi:hypothetical protein
MPEIHSTPLSEFNRSQALLSLTFPSLYPEGKGEFVMPRQRSIDYDVYLRHAMRWRDGRFARHPRFRFVAFNTLVRRQISAACWMIRVSRFRFRFGSIRFGSIPVNFGFGS